MRYHHTQKGPIFLFMLTIAIALAVSAGLFWNSGFVAALLLFVSALFLFFSLSFRQLTVEDQGEYLALRFGPLPLFGTRIPYAAMTAAEADQTSLFDGLGIHYFLGHGWTYNLWGSECVVIHLGNRVVRVGSDDVANLLSFLNGTALHVH